MKYNPRYYDPLLGKKFGRLVLLSLEPRKDTGHKKVIMARFRCDCGHEETRRLYGVIHSKEPMCMDCRYRLQRYHKNDPLYGTWVGMMDRCYKCKSPSYKWYGAKGIRVCEEWKSLAVFSEWAKSHGWYKGCNIDRVNRDGHYSPSNCRIVSPTINQQNRSDNVMLTHNGETRCESEWERMLGFPRGRIQGRRRMGMKGDDLFRVGRYQNNGSRKCVTDINKFPEHLRIRQVPWAKGRSGKVNARDINLSNIHAVCGDCARTLGFTPKDKAVGVWMGECGVCHQRKPCTNLWHDWEPIKKGYTK